jgi:cytochrome P450
VVSTLSDEEFDTAVQRFLTEPQLRADPYPFYRRMRETAPVYWSASLDAWFVTSFPGIQAVTRDPRWSHSRSSSMHFVAAQQGYAQQMLGRMILFIDPPQHTKLRALITNTFSVRTSERQRPLIRSKIDDAVTTMIDRAEVDFLTDVATPLPLTLTCELLGLPYEDAPKLHAWTNAYVAMLEFAVSEEHAQRGDTAFHEFVDYLEPFRAREAQAPSGNLTSDLVQAELAGELTADDVAAFCLFMMVGAHATTANMLTNAVLVMLQHPDQWARLQADPALAPTATEELLRWEAPARNLVSRWAATDLDLLGQPVHQGERVVGILGAANRDPAQFPDPETFDIGRSPNRHIAFGAGPHLCSGAALARIEVQEMLVALSRRCPALRITGDVTWDGSWTKRGLLGLLVSVG